MCRSLCSSTLLLIIFLYAVHASFICYVFIVGDILLVHLSVSVPLRLLGMIMLFSFIKYYSNFFSSCFLHFRCYTFLGVLHGKK